MTPSRRIIRTILFGRSAIIIPAAVMLIHCIILCSGCRYCVAENIVITMFAVILWQYDKALGFCFTHRLFILYALAVDWCINYERFIGFGSWLTFMHILMVVLGGILFIALIFHRCPNKKK